MDVDNTNLPTQPENIAPSINVVNQVQSQPQIQNPQAQPPQTEAIPVNKPSGTARRLSAAIIDGAIILGLWSVICLLIAFLLNIHIAAKNANNNPLVTVYGLLGGVISIIYYSYFHAHDGATPGKKLFGLKVSEINTSLKLTYPKAFLREIVKFGIAIIPILGGFLNLANVIVIIFSKTKQGLHDRVVKSQVIEVGKAISLWKQVLLYLLLLIFWGASTIILVFFVFSIGSK